MTILCAVVVTALAGTAEHAPPPAAVPSRTAESQATGPSQIQEDLPVSLDRIQRKLQRPPAVQVEDALPVFRVEVFGRTPTIQEFLGPLPSGPVPRGSAAHQEFLKMVTPTDYQGYAMFTNREALAVARMAFKNAMEYKAAKLAVQKAAVAVKKYQSLAIRSEIAAELAELEERAKKSGLPPPQ